MKQGWEIKKLGEVCVIERGGSPRPIDAFLTDMEDGINWIKIGDATPGSRYITSTKEKIKPEGIKKSRMVYKGDFILSNSMSFGKPYILGIDGCIHDGWLLLRDKNNTFDKNFLYYYLTSPNIYLEFKRLAVGGVVNNLNSELVRSVNVAIPPREEQEQIVSELDLLSGIIEKKREQLKELDALAQSIFYDMFGDPITNEKGWEVKKLKNITSKIGSGATPKGGNESYKTEGISLIRSLNVHNNSFVYKDLAYIDDNQAETLKNVTIEENDVLLNITGASVARCCVVPSNVLPARVNQHVAIIRAREILNNTFLCYLLTSHSYQQELISIGKCNGATREAITKGQLENLDIPLPPLPLQRQFASKIEAIERQKELIKQSISETETLFNARMQEHFG